MTQPISRRLILLIATLLIICVLPAAQAQVSGKKSIQRADGRWVTGEVQETPEGYVVTVAKGITVTIPKSEVRAIVDVEQTESQPGKEQAGKEEEEESENPERPSVLGDAEIEKLLEGTGLESTPTGLALEESELPIDEESVEQMKRLLGSDNIVTTKHAVIVYTSGKESARVLAERLESIWRWNVRFMKIINLPVRLPEHKLELYYCATHDEFYSLCSNLGMGRNPGILGFFTPKTNRSHFFDMLTWEPVKRRLEAAKKMIGPPKEREENLAKRWSEYETISVVQHELGHHIHSNIGLFPHYAYIAQESWDAMPTWLVEGTTMLFEVPPNREGASLGAVNHSRLAEFKKMFFPRQPSPEWVKMFVVNNGVWHSGYYYPMGWALVYYLWEEHRAGLSRYYHIIAARDPGDAVSYTQREQEFEDCFGKIDKKWVDEWWKFIKELPLKKSLLPVENYP
jgi:hypothetical protein